MLLAFRGAVMDLLHFEAYSPPAPHRCLLLPAGGALVPAVAAGHEIHGDLPLLALDGHLGRVASCSRCWRGDVLPPGEVDGAVATRRAPARVLRYVV